MDGPRIKKTPSASLDEAILARARKELNPQMSFWSKWILPAGGLVAASLLVFWLSIPSKIRPEIVEAPELLEHYDEIELMVETSQWTEDDWALALSAGNS